MSKFSQNLVRVAQEEWAKFGKCEHLLGAEPKIVSNESSSPFREYVGEYWNCVGQREFDGSHPAPWSAAFISYCFQRAGAGAHFPYRQGHWGYCQEILSGRFSGLTILGPDNSPLVGDLLWTGRSGNSSYETEAVLPHGLACSLAKRGISFASHADIVVEIGIQSVFVVGGNVKDTVMKVEYSINTHNIVDDKRLNQIGLIRNNLGNAGSNPTHP